MRRRKLLISIGALGAGGTAAFGTEAFTSVEAERSVDVEVAGDSSAFLAIQPLSGNNANQYVSTESGDTVALDFDGDAGTSGSGVNQDAITQVEDLFKIINQGTQTTNVYFDEDSNADSSAVTFRVTQSTDTETTGQNGQSLEGTSNSVELGVGDQVVVGITIDTLGNDVEGTLTDDVTIRAETGSTAAGQSIAQPQYVVDPAGEADDAGNVFQTVQEAVNAADTGAVIGIKNTGEEDLAPGSSINIDTDGLTLGGFEGTPKIDGTSTTVDNDAVIEFADGVGDITVTDVEIDYDPSNSKHAISHAGGSRNTVNGVTIDGAVLNSKPSSDDGSDTNAIDISGANISLTNNDVTGGGIQIQYDGTDDSSLQLVGNDVSGNSSEGEGILDEGIVVFNPDDDLSESNLSIDITNNRVRDVSSDNDLKLESSPGTVNGQTDEQDQIDSILTENDLGRIELPANKVSGIVSPQSSVPQSFTDIQSASDAADSLVLVESGTFDESVTIDTEGLTLEGAGADSSTIVGQNSLAVTSTAPNVEIAGFRIENPDGSRAVRVTDDATGVVIQNNTVTNVNTNNDATQPRGIVVGGLDGGDSADGLEIRNNTVTNVEGAAADEDQAHAIQILEESNRGDLNGGLIEDVVVDSNTIEDISDTRSTVAVNFNGKIEGEITNNDISGLNTEGNPDDVDPGGGFTQVIALNEGDNAADGPQNVTIDGNDISDIETTAPEEAINFAPPYHIIIGSTADAETISIEQNDFSADSVDPRGDVYIDDGTGDLDLDTILNDQGNTFDPNATDDGDTIVPE